MSVQTIKAFSDQARENAELGAQLKACVKMKELFALARDNGFELEEDSLYPPNEPQFTEEQLSERMVKALLRA